MQPGAVAAVVGAGMGGMESSARSSILASVSNLDRKYSTCGGSRVDEALALWRQRNKGQAAQTPVSQAMPAAATSKEMVVDPTSVSLSGDVTEAGETVAAAAALSELAAAVAAAAAADADAAEAPAPAQTPMQAAAAVAWAEAGQQSAGASAVKNGVAARAAGRYSPRSQKQGSARMYDITCTPGWLTKKKVSYLLCGMFWVELHTLGVIVGLALRPLCQVGKSQGHVCCGTCWVELHSWSDCWACLACVRLFLSMSCLAYP